MPTMINELDFYSLAKEDDEHLVPALSKSGMTIAYPHLAEPIVAQYTDRIVGFGFAQLIPHAEPIWVDPSWRGMGVAEELARRVVQKIQDTGAKRFISVAQTPFAERLCEQNGMIWVPGKVFVKEP